MNSSDKKKQQIDFLYTNIGCGHPFYLDGIIEAIVRSGSINLMHCRNNVFDVSSGLSLGLWKTALWLYKNGSSGGIIGVIYEHIRKDNRYDSQSLSVELLGKHIRKQYMGTAMPMLVAHPLLVAILNGRKGLIYQHGEVVVPKEAVVLGAEIVIVPTSQAALPFLKAGFDSSAIFVSGLCIEPALVSQAENSYHSRLQRIENGGQITGAFYSSGAEPRSHIKAIAEAACHATDNGNKVIIFAQKQGNLESTVIERFNIANISLARFDAMTPLPSELPSAILVSTAGRREESRLTAQLFPYFDYFVAPSHERTNWALGLGLPMFIVGPTIGPFAPLNRELLLNSGVAEDLVSMEISGNREHLIKMARAGWENNPIDGFAKIADYIGNCLEQGTAI